MNWGIIMWIAGIVATLYGIRFVLDLFKSLFGKESRQRMIASFGDKLNEANETVTEKIKEKAEQRKAERQRKKIEEEHPIIIRR